MPEPWSGSVRPNPPSSSIRAIGGSQRCFCSSEPHSWIDPIASPPCTPKNVWIDGSTRASSRAVMPSASALRPGHPGPSYGRPAMPSPARPGTRSWGNSARVQ